MNRNFQATWYVLLFLATVSSGCGSHESRAERLLREAALAHPRPVEGRLSVEAGFAQWTGSPGGERSDSTPLGSTGQHRILRGSRPEAVEHGLEDLHRTGLLSLYHGKAAHAVSALEAAAERRPTAAVLSDLAAAYLALAERDRPWLRVDAIVAATRALEREPGTPCAAFNLALALERMSLAYESILAWERYLQLEKDNGWRKEASERLARLRKPSSTDRWRDEKDRVAIVAGDKAALQSLARQFPRQIKELLEGELLSAWADTPGIEARKGRLRPAKEVAEVLAGTGERLYIEAIAAIERRPSASRTLADGHRAYSRGLALRQDCSQALPEFELARQKFAAGGSPMAWAARLQQLICLYRRWPANAEKSLAKLAASLGGHPYPTLLAKTEAMLGLCAIRGGRYSEAIPHYVRAARLLTSIGDTDAARLHGMIDEAYRFLGDREAAWEFRMQALQGAVAAGDRQVRHAVLAGLARDLSSLDRREASRVVLDEMLANAQAWGEPGASAETLLRRIQLDTLIGATDQAAADILRCARQLERFRQPADRHRVETELAVASAEHQLATSPAEALKLLAHAVSQLEANGDGLLLPRALLALAHAQISLGEEDVAQETFDRALRIYESRREETLDEDLRISFFATAQPSFDAMIRFQAFQRRDAYAAFAYSERVHARALRDRVHAVGDGVESPPLARQLAHIPANTAVFSYAVLPEVVLVWRLHQGAVKMYVLPATRAEVAEAVRSLRTALAGSVSREAAKTVAAQAFDLLLRPAFEGLPVDTGLVFVPDRELNQVPFAALFDRSRGRYLVEDHVCLVSPSLNLYLASLNLPSFERPRRVLAVGDPAFDRTRFPVLPRLPYAREEALAVAAMYAEARALVGEDATRRRILEALPGSQVLHLAAHVEIDPTSPLESFVVTADPGRRLLRAADLDSRQLTGVDLVFLAACDTAPGFGDGNREGVAGLARAFLAAGVPSVVATLWAVDDQAASRLAAVFHSRLLAGESPAQALRLAQLALLAEPSTSAPFAWAPYQLFHGL